MQLLSSKSYKYTISIVALISLFGCTATIMKQPIVKENRTWKVTISKAYDNVPYTRGNTIFQPESGHRLIRFTIKVENKTNKSKVFRLSDVVLAHKKNGTTPSIIDAGKGVNFRADGTPKLAPKETISRVLYYVFPTELKPDRVYIKGLGTYALPDYKKRI